MNLEEATFLVSQEGKKTIHQVEALLPKDFVLEKELLRLHKKHIPHIQIIVEQIALRRKAQAKFHQVSQELFTKNAIEQATREEIARYIALRYQPFERRIDLTAGIGGDSRYLLRGAGYAGAIERDPVIATLLQHNLSCWNLRDIEVLHQDAYTYTPPSGSVVYMDPMRRDALGRRTSKVQLWEPNPLILLANMPQIAGAGVKASPAFDYEGIKELEHQPEIELIGWQKSVKQAMWWFGELATPGITRRVTLLPSGWSLDNKVSVPEIRYTDIHQYIIDPHPGILRAQLADQFCYRYGLSKLDFHIGYFTSHDIPQFESPDIARVYRVIDVSKYNIRSLKKTLKTFHLESATLRQRGFPIELPTIQKKLKIPEGNDCTILFTHIGPSLYSIITERV